jgi:hypothetical protein
LCVVSQAGKTVAQKQLAPAGLSLGQQGQKNVPNLSRNLFRPENSERLGEIENFRDGRRFFLGESPMRLSSFDVNTTKGTLLALMVPSFGMLNRHTIRAATLETYCVLAAGMTSVISSLGSPCEQWGTGTAQSLPASVKNVAFARSSSAPHFRQWISGGIADRSSSSSSISWDCAALEERAVFATGG